MRDDDGRAVCPFVHDGHQLSLIASGAYRLAVNFPSIFVSEIILVPG
ncbi:hypothetical protein DevBK_00170 [Devosia sp. BK]|nr:hypothetical protein [Devosia sp. BK]MDV3249734.1 hypothetical protein [Devosia sp. BK]